jgi:indole-3-glycerol phosphate synthase
VPILCRDFILTRQQVIEARREGADAISLIVAAL